MSIQIDNSNAGKLTFNAPASGTPTLRFPTGQGATGTALSTDGAGQLSWGGGTPQAITMGLNTSATNATTNVSYLVASTVSAQNGISLSGATAQTGGVISSIPDGTITGGDARTGTTPLELTLQLLPRTDSTWVNQGFQSTVISPISSKLVTSVSGTGNTILGGYAQILGTATSRYTQIGGAGTSGSYNIITSSPNNLTIIGGRQINTDKATWKNTVLNGDGSRDGNGGYSVVSGWNYYTHWSRRTCVADTPVFSAAKVLTPQGGAESSTNCNFVPVDTSGSGQQICVFDARVVVCNLGTGGAVTGATGGAWRVTGAVKMGATAATAVFIGTPTITLISNDGSAESLACSIACTVGTALGSIQITCTGNSPTGLYTGNRWTCFWDNLNGSTQ